MRMENLEVGPNKTRTYLTSRTEIKELLVVVD